MTADDPYAVIWAGAPPPDTEPNDDHDDEADPGYFEVHTNLATGEQTIRRIT